MKACAAAMTGLAILGAFLTLIWGIVPIETKFESTYLNVYYLHGMSGKAPVLTYDNMTMPDVEDASIFNGAYSYTPQFYHKSFERFFDEWEERYNMIIWKCTYLCYPSHPNGTLVLAMDDRPSQGTWRLLEFIEDDNNSPVQHARTKRTGKKKLGGYKHRTSWVEMSDNTKPADIPGAGLYSAWDIIITIPFAITVVIIIGSIWAYFYFQDDDE